MNKKFRGRTIKQARWALLCVSLLLSFSACSKNAAKLDKKDESNPLVQKAMMRKRVQDYENAALLFERALEEYPQLAKPHLELAILYEKRPFEDHIRAIHHYNRYLEKRPKSDKREIVEGMIKWARLSFAASLPEKPSGAVKMIDHLQKENALLRDSIDLLEAQLSVIPDRDTGEGSVQEVSVPVPQQPVKLSAVVEKPVPPAIERVKRYTMQSGDTLTGIARRFYGQSSEWKKIYEANRDVLKSPGSVKAGQTLVIPDVVR